MIRRSHVDGGPAIYLSLGARARLEGIDQGRRLPVSKVSALLLDGRPHRGRRPDWATQGLLVPNRLPSLVELCTSLWELFDYVAQQLFTPHTGFLGGAIGRSP
jgi:hypothetical protein